MTRIRELVDLLQDAEGATKTLRDQANAAPDDEILQMNLESVARREADLVRRLDRALRVGQEEFVRYRVVREWTTNYPVKAVASSIAAFQELVTAVFDALRTTPKRRYRPTPESVELSAFDFAGATAGSVILSLSVPNERLLLGETDLDRALGYVERALSARQSEDLQSLAKEIGIAAITKAFVWADVSTQFALDTDVTWGKTVSGDRRGFAITRDEAEVVRELILAKSDTEKDSIEVDCKLLGFDGATSYFHIEFLDGQTDVRGDLSPDLPRSWTTGHLYRARLRRETTLTYATGEERVAWTLISLTPLTPPEEA